MLVLTAACGSKSSGTGTGGSGGGNAGTGGSAGVGGGAGKDASSDGQGEAGRDAGVPPDDAALAPSCAPGGPGMTNCGSPGGSCCVSALVTGGSYQRTYDPSDAGTAATDGGDAGGADPATVSNFRLDELDVTVGRFRQFVKVVAPTADGGAAWLPTAGSGKHAHLNGGLGLADIGSAADAGAANEPGWVASDDSKVSPTDVNLVSCGAASTWTPAAGANENLPINCVTWAEAYAFCIWDGGFLPSEAEWEYAAADGNARRAYPWGATDPGTMNRYAIYNCNYPDGSGVCGNSGNIAPVGTPTLGAGAWGQLDLAGNVWQWSLDWYANYVSPCADCVHATGGSSRVLRGGSFREDISSLQPPFRNANDPGLRNDFVGIRCARKP